MRAPLLLVILLAAVVAPLPAAADWSADTTIGNPVALLAGDQIEQQMVTDGAGGFILLWLDFRAGSESNLYCQRVSATGDTLWTAGGVVVCDAAGFQVQPTMIPDGRGGVFIAWIDLRPGNAGYFLQYIGSDGVRKWAANGIKPVSGINSNFPPKICRDTLGGVFLAFASGSPGTQITRIDSLGIKRIFGFPPAEGALLRGNPSSPAAIAADGAGGAIVTIAYGDLSAQRCTEAGALLWAVGGVPVCVATGAQGPATMVSDQAGGAIVAWVDPRSGAMDIYARHVTAAGVPQGMVDGNPICTAANDQLHLQLCPLPDGGAVALWRDYRNLPATSLYAQRIGPDGSVAWTADGQPVNISPEAMDRFAIVPGGDDSTYVTWSTSLGSGGNVFAQKLDGDGGLPWGEDRVTVCRGPNDQTYATAAPDGFGGFYVAYRDRRDPNNANSYAHHVGPVGMPGPLPLDVPPGVAGAAAALRGTPNPARAAQVVAFAQPVAAGARVEVLDIAGRRRIACAITAGATSWRWDGRGDDGVRVAPGLYFVRIVDGPGVAVARLVRLD